ncbi:MAG: 3-isopropylmalate dehydrogenase [Bacteroidales bacterium]|nr:3-isopropylmalate dehydrogenase [Bacteroidales bacterium]
MEKVIAVLPGDGIGPEITDQAVKALKAIEKKFGHRFTFVYGIIGASAIDLCGDPYPPETHNLCLGSDAILFGAIGDPKYDNNPTAKVRPEQGLLKMRKELGLYANIRPVELFESLIERSPLKEERIKGVDMIVVRELTGGIYFGEPRGRSENGEKAFDTCLYTTPEIERIAEVAFKLAINRRGHVTLVDKANVLETSRLWREVVARIHKQHYPGVILDYLFVDNAAMQLVTNPSKFDIILTENMFGDILSDEASVLTGSIGLLPSASYGLKTPLFEPIHGSYPEAAGKNIANPLATILSSAMLLGEGFGLKEEASLLKQCCIKIIDEKFLTPDLCGDATPRTTSEVGDRISAAILS